MITYSGGSLSNGNICTIQVDVTSNANGTYQNITSDLFSSLGVSPSATATLTVEAPPHLMLDIDPSTIIISGTSRFTYTIDNSANTLVASGLALTSNLPPGVTLTNPANISTTCTDGVLSVPRVLIISIIQTVQFPAGLPALLRLMLLEQPLAALLLQAV